VKIVDRKETIEREWFGVTLVIAAARTTAHVRKQKDTIAEVKAELGVAELRDEDWREVNARTVAGTILTDWKNLVINGEEIPFSEEAATSLLRDDDDTYEFVLLIAMDRDNFLTRSEDSTVKKSVTPSGGKLSMAAS
jgi:hypothetical protein